MTENEIIEGNRTIADSPFASDLIKNTIVLFKESKNGALDRLYKRFRKG